MKKRTTNGSAAAANTVPPSRTALVAVLGYSPAVLTETLWALARENPPVIPDEVLIVTTTTGRETLEQQLLTPRPGWGNRSVWQALRATLLGKNHRGDSRLSLATPVVIGRADPSTGTAIALDDIRTAADNDAAAETILTAVRRYTTDPDTRLVGLLAGGRKTMGALLHAALSLAGRRGDRLLHVLVNEPFDHPKLVPNFYFPGQPDSSSHHLPPNNTPIPHETARIEIADVPLVALGELVSDAFGHTPATFGVLKRLAGEAVADLHAQRQPITLRYEPATRTLHLNTVRSELPRGRCAALAEFLWDRARADAEHLRNSELCDEMTAAEHTFDYNGEPKSFSKDDVHKAMNELRDCIRRAGGDPLCQRLLPYRQPVGFNREGVTLQPA
jgi:CRISPR-associated protein (TIGR02584 family)